MRRVGIFIAFGTQGDVYPVAALAAGFAREQSDYEVALITHSAHQNLKFHLEETNVSFYSIDSPPTLSILDDSEASGLDFQRRKGDIIDKQRKECLFLAEILFGEDSCRSADFILINFFALEGWSIAEAFNVRLMVAAPYVVPYCPPVSFERQFSTLHPLLYKCLLDAPAGKVCWKDVMHWMWPLFTEYWSSWRLHELNLSTCPLTDLITGLPALHSWPDSPLLLYGFSATIVECPGYWPENAHACGFWSLPLCWQFSCNLCKESVSLSFQLCQSHFNLQSFIDSSNSIKPIFIGLSSIGRMGFLKDPFAFLLTIEMVIAMTNHRFILFTSGYGPMDKAIRNLSSHQNDAEVNFSLFQNRLFCFSGILPYKWIFPKCNAVIHHGGSGTSAAALHAGVPQIVCPFIMDQFYWAEKMNWIGVSAVPLPRNCLAPQSSETEALKMGALCVVEAIKSALSAETKAQAIYIARSLSTEDGVGEALKRLRLVLRLD